MLRGWRVWKPNWLNDGGFPCHPSKKDSAPDALRRLIGAATPFVSYSSRGHWRF
jgi:hypothetical protein